MVAFNIQKLKEKLVPKKERYAKENLAFKPKKAGTYICRAVPYPHVDNPEESPFFEKNYHFGIPGSFAVYCPAKNDGQECKVCDAVWSVLKENKGNKSVIDEYRMKLPQVMILIPVRVDGVLEEGSTVLDTTEAQEFTFLRFKSDMNRPSEIHTKLYQFFSEEPTWMEWDGTGYNIQIEYEKNGAEKAKRFGEFSLKRGGISLARKNSRGWTSEESYNEFLGKIPNIEEKDQFLKLTPEQVSEIAEKWLSRMEENQNKAKLETKNRDAIVISGESQTRSSGEEVFAEVDDDDEEDAPPMVATSSLPVVDNKEEARRLKLKKIEERLRADAAKISKK